MPDHCCVPGCKGNYTKGDTYVSVFTFPKDEERKKLWLKKIPRADFEPSKRAVVCEKHFRTGMIIREDFLPDRDGKIVSVPRKKPILKEDAYPCIFDGCPAYLSEKSAVFRMSRDEKKAQRDIDALNSFIEQDKISSFTAFQETAFEHIRHVIKDCECVINNSSSHYRMFFMNYYAAPKVEKSIVVDNLMNIHIFHGDNLLPPDTVKHLSSNMNLKLWSHFINLVTFVKDFENAEMTSDKDKVLTLWENIVQQDETNSAEYSDKHFVLDQRRLFGTNPKSRRYSSNLMTFAYTIFTKSAACYDFLCNTKIIHLPSVRHLKRITSTLSLNNSRYNEENLNYLTSKCLKLANHAKLVNILVDEIYVKENVQYKGKQISGVAENKEQETATTVQAFMISSLKSSYKEIIGLIPVKNQTPADLMSLTKQALELLTKAGFEIFSIISDNNRINRNMFKLLSPSYTLDLLVVNPFKVTNKFFLLFDTVHLMKSIRNNWINQKDNEKTFLCPKFDDFESTEKVSFSLIRRTYNLEKDSIVKYAPKLNFKVVYPTNIERQNVSLALKVFDESTCAALQKYGESSKFYMQWNPTVKFLQIIKKCGGI